jgi:hypothetical protein
MNPLLSEKDNCKQRSPSGATRAKNQVAVKIEGAFQVRKAAILPGG